MKTYWSLIMVGIMLWSFSAFGEPLNIVMDDYPPFSYEENGEIRGISTRVVKAALKEAGLDAEIEQLPFARAYTMTQEEANVFEYCVARTPEREPLFQWVGIVGPAEQVLFARKEQNVQIRDLHDVQNYVVGTTIEDIVDQYLLSKTQEFDIQLDRTSSSYETNMKKLLNGRVDLWGGNKFVGFQLAKDLGYSEQDIEVVYTFEELTSHYYLVTGLKTSAELVEQLRAAFEVIHQNGGAYQKILDEYFTTTSTP